MGVKLAEVEDGSHLTLKIRALDNQMEIGATLKRHLEDNIIVIDLEYDSTRRLVFDHVLIDMEYAQEDDLPIIWRNVKVVYYKSEYVLQVRSEGVCNNRRAAFRVSVAQMAWFRMAGRPPQKVMVKDISITGFAISDRSKDLKLAMGDLVNISFEDWGFEIRLDGRVVRIEEREDMTIYGFEICSQCNDLATYISVRQRRNLKQN